MALADLARLELARERYADAERYFREAVEIQRATLPAGDGAIARSLNDLSMALFRQRKFDQAIPVLEEAVRTAETAHGRQHVNTLIPLANLGVNYKEVGRLAESIRLLEQACGAAKHTPQLKVFKVQLLDAYAKAADPAQPASTARVTALMRDLLAEAREERPQDSPELAEQLAAVCQKLLGRKPWNDELEPLLREVLAIRGKSVPDDWSTFHAMAMLGGVLLGQHKLAEAEPLLQDGYQGMQDRAAAIPLKDKERIPEAATRLVALYTQWHAAEPDKGCDIKATEWQKKLDELKPRASAGAPSNTTESKPKE